MNKKNQFHPNVVDETPASDKKLSEDIDAEINTDDLAYNVADDSFELDVASDDAEYDHPDPYETSVKNGGDADSDYDEANPTAVHEYDKDTSLQANVEKMGMHIDKGESVNVDSIDEEMAKTPEDERDDLDAEGYPKNDMPMK